MTTLNLRPSFEFTGDPTIDRNFQMIQAFMAALGIYAGTGTPEGVVTAGIGAIYRRLDGGAATSIYIKEGNPTPSTGWVAK